jgi:putative ABC transport system ATP-binding protein
MLATQLFDCADCDMESLESQNAVVSLKRVRFSWPGATRTILEIENLTVDGGQHLFIQGASGCGKTTLLNLLCGINEADSGEIEVLGRSLAAMSALARDQFRADHLGVIFQQFNLLPYLNVLDNVLLPFRFSSRRREKVSDLSAAAKTVLQELEISPELFPKNVLDLSVGQQQRVAVARALVGNPELVIADEPTSALDRRNRNMFIRLLFDRATEHGSTLVFVSHDDHLADHFEHRIDLSEANLAYRGAQS